jgi:hypothetical protein
MNLTYWTNCSGKSYLGKSHYGVKMVKESHVDEKLEKTTHMIEGETISPIKLFSCTTL